ncbi:MAG TPA: ABC transporter ATP-binding protein [Bacteroidales bacterium]|nr:ABC transporter ATP-binding protein [Bacteroidales bacterium]
MKNEKAIIIKGLSKEYFKKDSSRVGFFDKFKQNKSGQSFFALKDINLEINKGEVIGIIGPNGAGKSTLLKILAEVTPPTSGSVEIFGKVASILEIGIGFQPELSGYENIFLSGKLYGLTKKQILAKLDKIIEMFGFPDFINSEVKHYSSGMYMRLAFSIIINIEADIYLFDEVLSVGDAEFQERAIDEIEKLKHVGSTIFIVTHTPITILRICDKILLLNKGTQISYSIPNKVLIEYKKLVSQFNTKTVESEYDLNEENLRFKKNIFSNNEDFIFDLTRVKLYNIKSIVKELSCNEDITLDINFQYKSIQNVKLVVLIKNKFDNVLVSYPIDIESSDSIAYRKLQIIITSNTFNEAEYIIDILVINVNNTIEVGYQNLINAEFFSPFKEIKNLSGYINLPLKVDIKYL